MKPVKFEGMNTNYVSEHSDDLPTMVAADETGNVTITSVWEFSAEDLECIQQGGKLCLCLYGQQPPVSLWVQEVNTVD
jgi:hypothetical protein